ncbi:MAG: ATP-dependent DNA helicase [Candidatus Shapirobacteria bacterium]
MTNAKVLNLQQVEAVEYNQGPLLIIAGAGTGKTTVITERVKNIVAKNWAKPHEILALTFTEKAALEMQTRVDEALPLGYANLWISTFHAFADRILRDEALHLGISSNYRLMTEAENVQFLRQNLFKFELEYFRPLGNPNKFVVGLLQHFSRLKDEDVSTDDYLKLKVGQEEAIKHQELAGAYQGYEELKIQEGVMDFADLISHLLALFRTRSSVLKKYRNTFKYLLVDEFQDTNYAQYQLVKLLAPPSRKPSLTVVGDDNQSIFRFRGAAISNIIQFQKDFPQAKQVVLNQNYRSTQVILDTAYRLIKYNDPDTLEAALGISKKLTAVKKREEIKPELIWTQNAEDEAEKVVEEIKNLDYKDVAILVRANNHAEPFIRALTRAGIPHQFLGPGQLFRQPEVKDLIAYLTVLNNFENSVAMYRVLAMDMWGISGRELAVVINSARKNNLSLFEAAEQSDQTQIKKIVTMMHAHLEKAKKESAGQILYYFLQESGLLSQLLAYQTPREEAKAQNLAKFFERLKSYESQHEDASVRAVMDFINLSLELGDSPLAGQSDWQETNAVNILTVHSAKGLEFPVVFLVNLVNLRFPTMERREQIPIPDALIKEILPVGEAHVEEERRLFYVGMTRAKERLFLTGAKFYHDGKREKKISPFVFEALGKEKAAELLTTSINKSDNQLSIFDSLRPKEVGLLPTTNDCRLSTNYLSYSQLSSFKTCPLQYKYRYLLRIPTPPSAALVFGDVIHQAMRDFYQRVMANQHPTRGGLLKILAENWTPIGYGSKAQEKKYWRQGQKILGAYYQKSFVKDFKPLALEQKFILRIASSLKAGGKIDRIDRLGDTIEIIDYKTGKSATQKEVDKDLQLTLYALAVADGTLNYTGVLPFTPPIEKIKVSFYFFDQQKKVTATRSGRDLDNLKKEIVNNAQAISQSDFKPTPGRHCDFCEFRLLCDAWR